MKKLMLILVIFILISFNAFAYNYQRDSEKPSEISSTKSVYLTKSKYIYFPPNLEYNIETETGRPYWKSVFVKDQFIKYKIDNENLNLIDPIKNYAGIRYKTGPKYNFDEKEFMAKKQRESELAYAKIKYFDTKRASFIENLLKKAIKTRNKVWI